MKKHKRVIRLGMIFVIIIALAAGGYAATVVGVKRTGVMLIPSGPIEVPDQVMVYRQDDPKWANENLGDTDYRIGSHGCLLAVLCTSVNYHGSCINGAGELNSLFMENDVYTKAGDIIWYKIKDALPGIDYSYRRIFTSKRIQSDLKKGLLPIIMVKYKGNGINHWVLVVGAKGDDFLVVDPLSDEIIPLSEHGGRAYAYRVLTPIQIDDSRAVHTTNNYEEGQKSSEADTQSFNVADEYGSSAVVSKCTSRKGPGENYDPAVKLEYGTLVSVTGALAEDRSWVRIIPVCGNGTHDDRSAVWIKRDCLSPVRLSSSIEKNPENAFLFIFVAVSKEGEDIQLKSMPEESSRKVGTVKAGDLLRIYSNGQVLATGSTRTDWTFCEKFADADISKISDAGWIKNMHIDEFKGQIRPNQCFLIRGTKVYRRPDAESEVLITVKNKLEVLHVNQEKGEWTGVCEINGRSGWVKNEDVIYRFSEKDKSKTTGDRQSSISSNNDTDAGGQWDLKFSFMCHHKSVHGDDMAKIRNVINNAVKVYTSEEPDRELINSIFVNTETNMDYPLKQEALENILLETESKSHWKMMQQETMKSMNDTVNIDCYLNDDADRAHVSIKELYYRRPHELVKINNEWFITGFSTWPGTNEAYDASIKVGRFWKYIITGQLEKELRKRIYDEYMIEVVHYLADKLYFRTGEVELWQGSIPCRAWNTADASYIKAKLELQLTHDGPVRKYHMLLYREPGTDNWEFNSIGYLSSYYLPSIPVGADAYETPEN